MTRRPALSRRLAHWSLLVAALLQFGAAAAGPYWHLAAPALPQTALAPEGQEEPEAPGPRHSEQACVVCQTVGSVGVVPTPVVLPVGSVARAPDVAEHLPPLPSQSRTGLRARAPPIA